VNTLRRFARLGALALLGIAVTGCCVLPPRGWGRGPYVQEGYYGRGGPPPGYSQGQGPQRPGWGDSRR
jgi:hypothetical protein